jgi:hypothetical protein
LTCRSHYRFKTIAIFSDIPKTVILDRLRAGAIRGCGKAVPLLTEKMVELSPRVVSQMGPEPFIDAMVANPDFDIIVGGRAYDPAPYAAYAAFLAGVKPGESTPEVSSRLFGGFTHMGKILECGGACAEPKSAGAIGTMYHDGSFDITPLDEGARCTPLSVAAHISYEKSRPDILLGPGGALDVTSARYEQLDDERTVRTQGSLFRFSRENGDPYQLKLEGAIKSGYRSLYMGSIRDRSSPATRI